jgi:hypothetical protein
MLTSADHDRIALSMINAKRAKDALVQAKKDFPFRDETERLYEKLCGAATELELFLRAAHDHLEANAAGQAASRALAHSSHSVTDRYITPE